jgi:hypothetical protein
MTTSISTAPAPASSLTLPPAGAADALQLSARQQQAVEQQLSGTDFQTLTLQDIATLGSSAEASLHQTLDGFLLHIDRFENTRLFNLFDALREGVDREDLPALADRILNSPLTLWQRALGAFNKKALSRTLAHAWEETQRMASGKTRTLSDKVNQLEAELATEQKRLAQEINTLEQLKHAYRERFDEFVTATGFLKALAATAQAQVSAAEMQASPGNPQQMFELDEARHKLQALQSRALAVEGTLSRLPSDQLVIRQLQNAGLATWQETTTTAAARFASIKMTLLTLHGALMTQGVQRLASQGKALDDSLSAVRNQLMRDVVGTSASLPGDNRLAQARQLQSIVAESRTLQGIVVQARHANTAKFEQARQLLAQAQQDMLTLSQQQRPDLPLRP